MSRMEQSSWDTMDPRARRTRRLLLDAFRGLMRERTYGRITVGDIADRATVNRATFYLHFRDKDALLDMVLREWTQEALDRSSPVPRSQDSSYLQVLLIGLCEFLARISRECPRSQKQFEGRLEGHVQAEVGLRVAAWLDLPGGASARLRTEPLRATVIGAGLYAAAQAWLRYEKRPAAEQFARRAVPVLLAPLGADGAAPAVGRSPAPAKTLDGPLPVGKSLEL